jgi:phosphatidylglycerol---prolipoprotein diacylglyceryl transferase
VLPYLPPLSIGPVSSFGVLAMLGMFFGLAAGSRHADRLGLDPALVRRMGMFCAIGGLLGAHYLDLLLYQPGWMSRSDALWRFVNPFAGISSYGGLLGGTIGFFVFAARHRIKRLRFADVAMVGVVVFLTFGRAGCASVHDHIGIATSSPLAVDFPANNPSGVVGPHHDLGLYELGLFIVLLGLLALVLHRPRRPGFIVGVFAIAYAVPRFFFDFLRPATSDPRYLALTPAQWCCIATVAAGIGVLIWIRTRGEPPPDRFFEATPWRQHARQFWSLRPKRA